jgi:hypothetical protein
MYVCISVVALVALETLGSNGSMRITQGQAEKGPKEKGTAARPARHQSPEEVWIMDI